MCVARAESADAAIHALRQGRDARAAVSGSGDAAAGPGGFARISMVVLGGMGGAGGGRVLCRHGLEDAAVAFVAFGLLAFFALVAHVGAEGVADAGVDDKGG